MRGGLLRIGGGRPSPFLGAVALSRPVVSRTSRRAGRCLWLASRPLVCMYRLLSAVRMAGWGYGSAGWGLPVAMQHSRSPCRKCPSHETKSISHCEICKSQCEMYKSQCETDFLTPAGISVAVPVFSVSAPVVLVALLVVLGAVSVAPSSASASCGWRGGVAHGCLACESRRAGRPERAPPRYGRGGARAGRRMVRAGVAISGPVR